MPPTSPVSGVTPCCPTPAPARVQPPTVRPRSSCPPATEQCKNAYSQGARPRPGQVEHVEDGLLLCALPALAICPQVRTAKAWLPRPSEEGAHADFLRAGQTPGAVVAGARGVQSYGSSVQGAPTNQHSKSGLPPKLPAADQGAAFASGRHPVQPNLFIAKAESHIRCLPRTEELPLELGRDIQPMHAIVQAQGAHLNVDGDVWQRAKDHLDSERTDEVAG